MEERRASAARQSDARPGNPGARSFCKRSRAVSERGRQVPRSGLERLLELHRPALIRRLPRSRRRSTAARWPMSPTRSSARPSRRDSSCPASAGSATTAPHRPATGSIAGRGPRPAPRCSAAARPILPASASIPKWGWSWPANRRVLYNRASCDLERQALGPRAPAGLVERGAAALGRQWTSPTSSPIPRQRTTWARSS